MTVALFILGLELLTNALRGIQGNTVPSQLAIGWHLHCLLKSEQHSCRNKFSDFTMGSFSSVLKQKKSAKMKEK